MGYINTYLNKYTYINHYNSICSDSKGGLLIPNPNDPNSILNLDFQYQVINEIKVPNLQEQVNSEGLVRYSKRQSIFNISVIEESIFLSLSDNTTCIINRQGEILNVLHTYYPSGDNKYESPNNTIRCIFKRLADQKILTIAQSKFQGSQIALSKTTSPDYLSQNHIDSEIISHSYNFSSDYMCPVFNATKTETVNSLLKIINNDRLNYSEDKDPNKTFIHYASEMKIWDLVEIDNDYILLFVYTSLSNKADQPNINMPYYFCKMEKSTGIVVKSVSPIDRNIYYLNLFPKFIINGDRILFKTTKSIYQVTADLELIELIEFAPRSSFKKFVPIAFDDHSIHYIIPDKTELFSYPNSENVELSIKNLEKEYKTQKKSM